MNKWMHILALFCSRASMAKIKASAERLVPYMKLSVMEDAVSFGRMPRTASLC